MRYPIEYHIKYWKGHGHRITHMVDNAREVPVIFDRKEYFDTIDEAIHELKSMLKLDAISIIVTK